MQIFTKFQFNPRIFVLLFFRQIVEIFFWYWSTYFVAQTTGYLMIHDLKKGLICYIKHFIKNSYQNLIWSLLLPVISIAGMFYEAVTRQLCITAMEKVSFQLILWLIWIFNSSFLKGLLHIREPQDYNTPHLQLIQYLAAYVWLKIEYYVLLWIQITDQTMQQFRQYLLQRTQKILSYPHAGFLKALLGTKSANQFWKISI